MDNNNPKPGDLRAWWIPQIPGRPFYVWVDSPEQARLITDTLARYDLFQLSENVKGDYSNAGGLEVFEDGDWVDWYSDDGDGFDEWCDS